MKRLLIYILPLLFFASAEAQVQKAVNLQVQKISGGRLFKKNISFADFQTKKLRRSIGSFFATRAIIPANLLRIEGVPLYHKEKRRSKDYFHFDLKQNGDFAAYVEVQAIMLQNETFRLFSKQDSSFFGKANSDLLLGSVQPSADTATWWEIAAWNLNATKQEAQKGIIKQGSKEITFEKTTMLLRENGDQNSKDTLFSSLYMAYQFRYKGETIAAVAYKEHDRLCWMKKDLDDSVQTAVAATISILRLRRNIYK
jgi:hypothetical protein